MEFRLLGPLEVVHGGDPVALGGRQRRTLLALLLTHLNEAVSADYLIDELWGESPPPAARKSLQAHIAHLRAALNSEEALLWAQPPGYVLSLDPMQVDARRFESAVQRVAGDLPRRPGRAREEIEVAMALWRGSALADVADESPTLRAEASRLNELRLVGEEQRIRAELALGNHVRLVPDLEHLTGRHPLREGLWAALMLALYRSGRQADALAAFQKARRLLGEELGIDASPELRRLEDQILLQSAELTWVPPDIGDSEFDRAGERTLDGSGIVASHRPPPPAIEEPLDAVLNLPEPASSFVGRRAEIGEVIEALANSRLVTVTGAGGSGKTRLGLRVASEVEDRYPDGVRYVALADLDDPVLVGRKVAGGLGATERPDRTWIETISRYLHDRRLLLVLDNCEHLLGEVAGLVREILQTAPEVAVLTTSREPLGVTGELTWQIPLLSVPPAGQDASIQAALRFEAAELFADRARHARPGIIFSDGDASAIGRICRRLDGLPLAIELAAARLRAFSVREIADYLDERFDLLVGSRAGALPRHQTLEAAVRWSYDLLDPDVQQLLARLAVFAGGFDIEAARMVADGTPLGVTALVDKSLLVAERRGDRTRYRMLESVAEFGRDRLGERLNQARDAHLDWATRLSRTAAARLEGREQAEWIDRVETDLDNLRAAMQWALDGDNTAAGMVIASSLFNYWYMRGVREGARWIERFLDRSPEVSDEVLAWALFTGGALLHQQGDDQSERAGAMLQASLDIFERMGDAHGVAEARHHRARTRWGSGDPLQLKAELDAALAGYRQVGDDVGVATSLLFELWWQLQYGERGRAVAVAEELQPLTQRIGSANLLAHGLELSATAGWNAGDFENTAPLLHSALTLYRRLGNTQCSAHCLESTAGWILGRGAPELAALLLAATAALRSDIGVEAPRWERFIPDQARVQAQAMLGEADFERAWRSGLAMSFDDVMDRALALTAGNQPDTP